MHQIKAFAFDTGGTVLDWHGGVSAALRAAGSNHGLERDWAAITNVYRRAALGRMKGQVAPSFNIDDVHRLVLDEIVEAHGLDALTSSERDLIAQSWHNLSAWSDFRPAVERLRQRYAVVSFTILSLALVMDVSRRNDLHWDAIVSCEMLGVYKPLPAAYDRVAGLLRLDPAEIVMVACHNADLLAARGQGFRTAFVRRPDEWGAAGPPDPEPHNDLDFVANDFAELAAIFDA